MNSGYLDAYKSKHLNRFYASVDDPGVVFHQGHKRFARLRMKNGQAQNDIKEAFENRPEQDRTSGFLVALLQMLPNDAILSPIVVCAIYSHPAMACHPKARWPGQNHKIDKKIDQTTYENAVLAMIAYNFPYCTSPILDWNDGTYYKTDKENLTDFEPVIHRDDYVDTTLALKDLANFLMTPIPEIRFPFPDKKTAKILDFGAGCGALTATLRAAGYTVVALEPDVAGFREMMLSGRRKQEGVDYELSPAEEEQLAMLVEEMIQTFAEKPENQGTFTHIIASQFFPGVEKTTQKNFLAAEYVILDRMFSTLTDGGVCLLGAPPSHPEGASQAGGSENKDNYRSRLDMFQNIYQIGLPIGGNADFIVAEKRLGDQSASRRWIEAGDEQHAERSTFTTQLTHRPISPDSDRRAAKRREIEVPDVEQGTRQDYFSRLNAFRQNDVLDEPINYFKEILGDDHLDKEGSVDITSWSQKIPRLEEVRNPLHQAYLIKLRIDADDELPDSAKAPIGPKTDKVRRQKVLTKHNAYTRTAILRPASMFLLNLETQQGLPVHEWISIQDNSEEKDVSVRLQNLCAAAKNLYDPKNVSTLKPLFSIVLDVEDVLKNSHYNLQSWDNRNKFDVDRLAKVPSLKIILESISGDNNKNIDEVEGILTEFPFLKEKYLDKAKNDFERAIYAKIALDIMAPISIGRIKRRKEIMSNRVVRALSSTRSFLSSLTQDFGEWMKENDNGNDLSYEKRWKHLRDQAKQITGKDIDSHLKQLFLTAIRHKDEHLSAIS